MQTPIEAALEKKGIVVLEKPQTIQKCEGCGAHVKEILKH